LISPFAFPQELSDCNQASRLQVKASMQDAGAGQDHQDLIVGDAGGFVHGVDAVEESGRGGEESALGFIPEDNGEFSA
jgi:hypothetical protein